MPRKALRGCVPRTIRLHKKTYDAILEFFSRSPEGLTGSEAIRKVVYEFGLRCQAKLNNGLTASTEDIHDIPLALDKAFEEQKENT